MSTHSSESEEVLISTFCLGRLWVKRFFRQSIQPVGLGLVGLMLVFVLGLEPHINAPVSATASLSPNDIQGQTEVTPKWLPQPRSTQLVSHLATHHRLVHSHLTSAMIIHHRLTGAHLLMSETVPKQQVSDNSQQATSAVQ